MNDYFKKAAQLCGHKETYSELKRGADIFDLSIWDEAKAEEEFKISFACREQEVVEGLYTCKKCNGTKCYTRSIQTRSGDEATDVFALCANEACKSKPWKVG